MHRILFLPDIRLIEKPDIWLKNYIFSKISKKFINKAFEIIVFSKY
jgi:hypothetical protein